MADEVEAGDSGPDPEPLPVPADEADTVPPAEEADGVPPASPVPPTAANSPPKTAPADSPVALVESSSEDDDDEENSENNKENDNEKNEKALHNNESIEWSNEISRDDRKEILEAIETNRLRETMATTRASARRSDMELQLWRLSKPVRELQVARTERQRQALQRKAAAEERRAENDGIAKQKADVAAKLAEQRIRVMQAAQLHREREAEKRQEVREQKAAEKKRKEEAKEQKRKAEGELKGKRPKKRKRGASRLSDDEGDDGTSADTTGPTEPVFSNDTELDYDKASAYLCSDNLETTSAKIALSFGQWMREVERKTTGSGTAFFLPTEDEERALRALFKERVNAFEIQMARPKNASISDHPTVFVATYNWNKTATTTAFCRATWFYTSPSSYLLFEASHGSWKSQFIFPCGRQLGAVTSLNDLKALYGPPDEEWETATRWMLFPALMMAYSSWLSHSLAAAAPAPAPVATKEEEAPPPPSSEAPSASDSGAPTRAPTPPPPPDSPSGAPDVPPPGDEDAAPD